MWLAAFGCFDKYGSRKYQICQLSLVAQLVALDVFNGDAQDLDHPSLTVTVELLIYIYIYIF